MWDNGVVVAQLNYINTFVLCCNTVCCSQTHNKAAQVITALRYLRGLTKLSFYTFISLSELSVDCTQKCLTMFCQPDERFECDRLVKVKVGARGRGQGGPYLALWGGDLGEHGLGHFGPLHLLLDLVHRWRSWCLTRSSLISRSTLRSEGRLHLSKEEELKS